jgi:hypothetical protein
MRCFLLVFTLASAAFCCVGGTAFAQTDSHQAELAAARRALAVAKIEARHYWQVEYRCERRELDAAIRVADEEVRTMRRQLRTFGPFNPYAHGQQPAFAYRNAKLCLAEAEAGRRLLIDQRNDLARSHADHLALLELNVAEARARVVELAGGGVIELDVAQR